MNKESEKARDDVESAEVIVQQRTGRLDDQVRERFSIRLMENEGSKVNIR